MTTQPLTSDPCIIGMPASPFEVAEPEDDREQGKAGTGKDHTYDGNCDTQDTNCKGEKCNTK